MDETSLIPYEDMLKAGMHFGRKKTVFNPGMKDYVFTVRNGICIIDLLKTQDQVKIALDFLHKNLQDGKLVLFVALTKQSRDMTKALAESVNMPFVLDRWLGGTLTNFKIINSRVKRLEEMERQKLSGELEKYTKKERLMFDRELDKMIRNFAGLKKLIRLPDVIFVSSLKESETPIREANRMKVKVVGIANTDSNPNVVDFVVPANDRSKKSVDLILEFMRQGLASVKV